MTQKSDKKGVSASVSVSKASVSRQPDLVTNSASDERASDPRVARLRGAV